MAQVWRSAMVRLPQKRLLRVEGADVVKFLQGIFSNDMQAFATRGDARYGGFLNHKGRLLGDAEIVQTAHDTFFIACDEAVSNDMLKHLKKYKLRSKVKFDAVENDFALHAILPSLTATNDELARVQQWKESVNQDASNDALAYSDPRGDVFGLKAILPAATSLALPEGFAQDDDASTLYRDRRILLGACEGLEHLDAIPLEQNFDMLHGVSFTKGCYVGQELTARTHYKGSIRKRLVPVLFLPAAAPAGFSLADGMHDASWMTQVTAMIPSGVDVGSHILRADTEARVGKIATVAAGVNAAVAMMRMEHLTTEPMDFVTKDAAYHVLPYVPSWWRPLDASTGKPVQD
ncbi:hypothetical protein SPRG_08045 [Saprolegnia parasitica CBS 223.65]|uniref:Uncharacterized protein n=1 Tax=Saprolegnia parasitica (strain CBS 223.65) TaxID=695850 RepID=A0A067CJC5_SAPPC|nr:hypothetical protein SPRG_08045 [Saprolegnia parasitica CBS 223.65]KDO26641.1 hypothetical protein SPRG_08045 [Saprolegnia parasitica CBS 223.65]|eukprot:XP_012202780.1 hypothetical protein SPRG_08045 [Saprolegnia parasitica CBS 223.65]